MPDPDKIRAEIEKAQLNRLGAVTDATMAINLGYWAQAAHYCADAAFWDGRASALIETQAPTEEK